MPDQQNPEVVIVAPDGTEHVFPPGFDPKRAAAIVKGRMRGGGDGASDPLAGLKSVLNTEKDLVVGAAKGLGNTVTGLGQLAYNYLPGVARLSDAINGQPAGDSFTQARQALAPTNTAQKIGFMGEQVGEYFVPGAASEKAAAKITSKVAPYLSNLPSVLQGAAKLVPRMGTEAVTNGLITGAQGGNPLVGSGVGAAIPVAGRVAGATVQGLRGPYANSNAMERAAVLFGASRGIPIDAATASGSNVLRTAQKMAGNSIGGAPIAERFTHAQTRALSDVGRDLAAGANRGGLPTDAVMAGERVQSAITQKIQGHAAQADAAYGRLRGLEEQAQKRILAGPGGVTATPTNPPGVTSRPAFTSLPLAVDIIPTKQAMQPIYEALRAEADLVPLMGDKARALTALDRLMKAPDLAPLSVADGALGELKSVARVDQAFRRTTGQGVAAEAVKSLEQQVQAAAKRGGPDVYKALMQGRAATVAKHEAMDVLDLLRQEPAATFRQLTANRDGALSTLQAVKQQTPGEVKNVARAYLEGMMDTATAEGGFGHADKLWAEWNKLGPRTKAILFPNQQHLSDLNNFFLLAKTIANKGSNTSGTAYTMHALNLVSAVPMNVLARALYSPAVSRQLMAGITTGNAQTVANVLGRLGAAGAAQATQ